MNTETINVMRKPPRCTPCDALTRLGIGAKGCKAYAQVHDERVQVYLCAAHKLKWFSGCYVRGLGFRSDRIADIAKRTPQ